MSQKPRTLGLIAGIILLLSSSVQAVVFEDSVVLAPSGAAEDVPPPGLSTEAWRAITRSIERNLYG